MNMNIQKDKKLEEQFQEIESSIPEKIDTSKFIPLSSKELIKILGLTIKEDETNKLATFLSCLLAYTDNSQINISFNAPSSTGKSYIPIEIVLLFPNEDVKEIGYCSPTAFFHDVGKYEKEDKKYIVDLERKILIFLDQPHSLLLQHLRPILSHDKKEIVMKITDKNQRSGLRTKNISIRGFPTVIFCTAGLRIDEQESTRFILLSPEMNQNKIRHSISEKILLETDRRAYKLRLSDNTERALLKERVRAIRNEHITDIRVSLPEKVEEVFFSMNKSLKPRHMRDIGRFISLIKAFALLNVWHREREGTTVITSEGDLEEAIKLWTILSESQDLNIPPCILNLYKEVILPACREEASGITRKKMMLKHYEVYSRPIADWQLRQQIIPMLENAGLIYQEADKDDKRKMLVYPMKGTNEIYSE